MDKYQSLRIWSYQHPNEALENEYLVALKDDEVKHYLKDEVWSKIWLLLDILTKRGILIKTKNASLTRRLADNYLDKLLG